MSDEEESGEEQQVYQVRERSQTISVPRPSEPGREEGQPIYQVRERARTMNVQRHGEPGLTCVRPAPAQLGSWSTGEPMISKHRTLPCQCDKCAADRASQHPTGEIDEWGDNLVQRDRYDLTEGEEE